MVLVQLVQLMFLEKIGISKEEGIKRESYGISSIKIY